MFDTGCVVHKDAFYMDGELEQNPVCYFYRILIALYLLWSDVRNSFSFLLLCENCQLSLWITLFNCFWRQRYKAWAACFWQSMNGSFHQGLYKELYSLLRRTTCTRSHTHLLLHPRFFLAPITRPLSFSVLLSSNHFVCAVSTIQTTFPFYSCFHSYTNMHTPSLTPPTLSPGCHSNSVGRERHPCFTPICNHTPILFLLPLQSHLVHPSHPIPTPLHLQVASSSQPIGIVGLYITAGGIKLLSNNEGKKERS